MKIEMTELEYLDLFGSSKDKQAHEREYAVNGVKFVLVECQIHAPSSVGWAWEVPQKMISLTLIKPKHIKSPQQLSAEESVKKAEDALEAAKEVLNQVKGSK